MILKIYLKEKNENSSRTSVLERLVVVQFGSRTRNLIPLYRNDNVVTKMDRMKGIMIAALTKCVHFDISVL